MGLLDKGYIWRSMSLCVVLALPAQKKKKGGLSCQVLSCF
jgi:hypothetical protein